ncbi:Protein of unknown function [Gryllus bimaculatus]|nr:Protein of unknown function [Gryllus bimaculatus]
MEVGSEKKLSSQGGESTEVSTEKKIFQKCSDVVKHPNEIYENYRSNSSLPESQEKDSGGEIKMVNVKSSLPERQEKDSEGEIKMENVKSSLPESQEKDSEEKIKMVNVKSLNNSLNEKLPNADSESECEDVDVKKKKVLRKRAKKHKTYKKHKKGKKPRKDIYDKYELSSDSEHLDILDNDGNEKGGLKEFLHELQKQRDQFAAELLLVSSDSDLDIILTKYAEKRKKKEESEIRIREQNEENKETQCLRKNVNDEKQRKNWCRRQPLLMKFSENNISERRENGKPKMPKENRNNSVGED